MIFILVLFALVAAGAGLSLWLNQEIASPVKIENPGGGAGTALVVDHAGRGSFHSQVVASFVRGLAGNGWRVEITTASPQAPLSLAGYDLLVVGSPIYGFAPSRPIRRYLERLGDLTGQPTVTILTGLGAGGRAAALLEAQVRRAGGRQVRALVLYRLRPNDNAQYENGPQNRALALVMAAQAARDIPLPEETDPGQRPA